MGCLTYSYALQRVDATGQKHASSQACKPFPGETTGEGDSINVSTKRKRGKNLPAISSFSSRSGTRTRVSTVRGWRANRYTNRPLFQTQGAVSPCFRVQSYCLLAKLPNLSAKKIRLFSSRAITQLNINQIKNTQIQALPYRAFFIPRRG